MTLSTAIDKDVIDTMVSKMVEENGLRYFPNFIERALYSNVITLGLKLIDAVLGKTKLVIFGHEVVLDIRPSPIVID